MKPLSTALVALALFVTACGSSDDESTDTTDATAEAVTEDTSAADASTDDADESTDTADDDAGTDVDDTEPADDAPAEPATFMADAPLFAGEFMPIAEGAHRFGTLGTEFSLTVAGEWFVQPNNGTFAVLTGPDSRGPGDRDVVLLRVSGLSDPTQPSAAPEEQVGWPPNDITGWIDNLIDGVTTTAVEDVTVGGLPAKRFEISIEDDAVCGPFFCVGFATNQLVNSVTIEPGFDYVIHWVAQGDEDPIMVLIGSPEGNDDWRVTAEGLLATMAFGETQPNPIMPGVPFWEQGLSADVPAGEVTLPAMGGVTLTLPEDRFIATLGDGWVAFPADMPADVEMFLATATPDGTPLTTIDEVVEQIGSDATLTEIDGATYPLGDARVFDVAGSTLGEPDRSFGVATGEGGSIWARPQAGRIWLFDTERGVVAVTAESFQGDTFVAEMIELAESLLPSIMLSDPPSVN